ncbi:hypothetical protein G5C65_09495, partial [Streptomyces sp. SB3404]|nr:hypothetical protein [Streptomyces boncukensis]
MCSRKGLVEVRIQQRWQAAPQQQRQTALLTVGSAVLGLAVALTTVAASGPWDSGQRTAERAWAAREARGSGAEHTAHGRGGSDSELSAPEVLVAAGPAPGRGDDAKRPSARPGGSGGESGATGGSGGRDVQTPPPTASGLADALEPLLRDGALGTLRTASVVDAVTGRELYTAEPGT